MSVVLSGIKTSICTVVGNTVHTCGHLMGWTCSDLQSVFKKKNVTVLKVRQVSYHVYIFIYHTQQQKPQHCHHLLAGTSFAMTNIDKWQVST